MHNLNHDKSRSIFYFLHLLIFLFIYTLEKMVATYAAFISVVRRETILYHILNLKLRSSDLDLTFKEEVS